MQFFGKHWKLALIIIVLLSLAVLCCIKASSWESNTVSMISGLWSAVATFVVGVIAFWQTKKYKEQADHFEDLMNAPEFYLPSFLAEFPHGMKTGYNRIMVRGEAESGVHGKNAFKLMSYDKPIIHLKPIKVRIDEVIEPITISPQSGIDINYPHDAFTIGISGFKEMKDGLHDIEMIITFENMYGTKYKKKLTGVIRVVSNTIQWIDNEKLSKAERINNHG